MFQHRTLEKLSRKHPFLDGINSIFSGMVSVFSWGTINPTFSYEERFGTDEELLASDWQAVGNDLRTAMGQINTK